MSLYYVQKMLWQINRSTRVQQQYHDDFNTLKADYSLTEEEERALTEPNIGLLYVLGVNGQILMHFAAFHQIEWEDYKQRMRDGIKKYGAVREGIYAMTGDGKDFT